MSLVDFVNIGWRNLLSHLQSMIDETKGVKTPEEIQEAEDHAEDNP